MAARGVFVRTCRSSWSSGLASQNACYVTFALELLICDILRSEFQSCCKICASEGVAPVRYVAMRERADFFLFDEGTHLVELKETCFLCVLMFAGTVVPTVLGMAVGSVELSASPLLSSPVMLVAFSVMLRQIIAKVNAFFLIQTSLGFSIGGASMLLHRLG